MNICIDVYISVLRQSQTENRAKTKAGLSGKVPVRGMDVSDDSGWSYNVKGREIRCCSTKCLDTFKQTPDNYLLNSNRQSQQDKTQKNLKEGDKYTCPVHPEVEADTSGSCPKCGMALEKGSC